MASPLPSFQHVEVITRNVVEDKVELDFHPEHGLLPPLISVQSMPSGSSYNCFSDDHVHRHPQYGLLPSPANIVEDDSPQSSNWTGSLGSESELGGQTFSSMPSTELSTAMTLSTVTSSMDVCREAEEQSVSHVAKLEERIHFLTVRLEETFLALDKKNTIIQQLQSKISTMEDLSDDKKHSKMPITSELERPRALPLGSDPHLRSSRSHGKFHALSTPGSSPGIIYQRSRSGGSGESAVYNNFINTSRKTTPIPSISTV